ncbi:hypothetical protein [Actinomadura fibrosa]|uniref:Orc1-like AAA ATPase domain-containing protein n=1 Tax=Actinomadura fibrosa TaxID=111802 RepID=A0ABW2XQ61_9ACTN
MSASDEPRVPPIDDNPFPPGATAGVQNLTEEVVTVETAEVVKATRLLTSYFQRSDEEQGRAVMVIGEAGSGKSHLLFDLLRRTRDRSGVDGEHMYIDSQGSNFLDLYKGNFLAAFNQDEVVSRLRRYYADIVADSLKNTGFPDDVTSRVRDTTIDPQRFVNQFNLAESAFLEEMKARLREVTRDEEFGTALTLLMRRDLARDVWAWLEGNPPSPLLRERNITSHIDGESKAIEAMGVLALLYRGRTRHFVLAFDQLEKVLPSASPPTRETREALRRLIELMTDQGIFLVLSGLRELDTALEPQEEGVVARIEPKGLTQDEVRTYIERCVARKGPGLGLGPFNERIAEYIAYLAGDSARRVVQICWSCYAQSRESGQVTQTMVDQAAIGRAQQDRHQVDRRIREQLSKQGRNFERNHPVQDEDGPRAPYWVPVGSTGCALFVTESLIRKEDAKRLIRDAESVRRAAPRGRLALIVNGFLSAEVEAQLKPHFDEDPLTYVPATFAEQFSWLMRHMSEQIEMSSAAQDQVQEQLNLVRGSVNRLSAAQGSTQNFLETLMYQVEKMHSTLEQQYTELARGLLRDERDRAERPSPLPDDVEQEFATTLGVLRELTGLDTALGELFGRRPTSGPPGLLMRLQNREVVSAVGVATLAEQVIEAFRASVGNWCGELDGVPTDDQIDTLNALSRNYETIVDFLPVSLLGSLTDVVAEIPSRSQAPGRAGERVLLSRTDMYALLRDLGHRVRGLLAQGGRRG